MGTGRKNKEQRMISALSRLCAMPLGFIGNMGIGEIIVILSLIAIPIIVLIIIIRLLTKKRK